jgi:hypothetical protein
MRLHGVVPVSLCILSFKKSFECIRTEGGVNVYKLIFDRRRQTITFDFSVLSSADPPIVDFIIQEVKSMFLNYSVSMASLCANSIRADTVQNLKIRVVQEDSDVYIYMNSGDQHARVCCPNCRLGTLLLWMIDHFNEEDLDMDSSDDCSNNTILSALASLWRHFLSQCISRKQ